MQIILQKLKALSLLDTRSDGISLQNIFAKNFESSCSTRILKMHILCRTAGRKHYLLKSFMQIDTISESKMLEIREKLVHSAENVQKYLLRHKFFEKPYPL